MSCRLTLVLASVEGLKTTSDRKRSINLAEYQFLYNKKINGPTPVPVPDIKYHTLFPTSSIVLYSIDCRLLKHNG